MEAKILYCVVFLPLMFANISEAQIKSTKNCDSLISEVYVDSNNRFKRQDNRPEIVGGTLTVDKEFSHMVALGYGNTSSPAFLCGGTLISEQYVLTAAHCASLKNGSPVKIVRLGTRFLTAKNGFVDAIVTKIIKHPDYKAPSSYNDVALLKLKERIFFSSSIFPACLHTTKDLTESQKSLTALGWGKIDFVGPSSDNLMKVSLAYSPATQCSANYKNTKDKLPNGLRDNQQICAGGVVGKDTCQGDSGGPLEYKTGNIHMIVGITSFGKACGISGSPGVYARVSAYVPWIESIVW